MASLGIHVSFRGCRIPTLILCWTFFADLHWGRKRNIVMVSILGIQDPSRWSNHGSRISFMKKNNQTNTVTAQNLSNLQNPYTGSGGALDVSQMAEFFGPLRANRFSGGWMTIVYFLSSSINSCFSDGRIRPLWQDLFEKLSERMTIAHDTWLLTICKCDLLQHRFCEICFGSFKELGENWRPRVSFWMSFLQEQNKITAIDSILWRRCRRALASCNIPSPLGVWTVTKNHGRFDTIGKAAVENTTILQWKRVPIFRNWRESAGPKPPIYHWPDLEVPSWPAPPDHRWQGLCLEKFMRDSLHLGSPLWSLKCVFFHFFKFSFWRWCWVGRWLLPFVESAMVVCFYYFSLLTPSYDLTKLRMWKKRTKTHLSSVSPSNRTTASNLTWTMNFPSSFPSSPTTIGAFASSKAHHIPTEGWCNICSCTGLPVRWPSDSAENNGVLALGVRTWHLPDLEGLGISVMKFLWRRWTSLPKKSGIA